MCAVVKGYPIVIRNSDDPERKWGIPFDAPLFHWQDPKDRDHQLADFMEKTFGITPEQSAKAMKAGDQAQHAFRSQLKEAGAKVLKEAEENGTYAVVLASRPYQNDALVNHDLPEMLTGLGIPVLTADSLPEVEEVEVEIDLNDCRFDVFRASGNGGQCVNTTDSAVRLTHIPTGIVVSCQDEKSQLKNKDKALKVLRSRLYELEQQKAHDEEAAKRKSQIGTGDRSEKIRTYNFPQGRVTDHRIKLTLHKLDSILNGDLDEVIDSLIAADQTAKLAKMED